MTTPKSIGVYVLRCSLLWVPLSTVTIWATPATADSCGTPDNLYIWDSQADIDDIQNWLPCDNFRGRVKIRSGSSFDPITNLDGLDRFTSFDYYLIIEDSPDLVSLSGLSNVAQIGGYFVIRNLDSLQNLNGLSSLENLGGGLYIQNNENLVSLASMPASHLSLLRIEDNPRLSSLSDLYLASVGDDDPSIGTALSIYNNDSLQNLGDSDHAGLRYLGSAYDDVRIIENASLRSVDALLGLKSLDGSLTLALNPNLTECTALAPLLGWPDGPPAGGITGSVSIYQNGPGCESVDAILASVTGPTKPAITNIATQADKFEMSFTSSTTSDQLFPIFGYEASCIGRYAAAESSPERDFRNEPIQEILTISGYDPVASRPDLEVDVKIRTGPQQHIRVLLTTPEGTELVLWDQQAPDNGWLVGTFPSTLTPAEGFPDQLSVEAMDGDWKLLVEDVDFPHLDGTLHSWGLRIKEELTATSSVSPIEIPDVTEKREYTCTVAPTTKLGAVPASDPYIAGGDTPQAFVERHYFYALGRPSDPDGLSGWVEVMSTQSAATVPIGFLTSAEFTNRGLDNSTFVDTLYRAFFDRPASAEELNAWVSQLAQGRLREMVIWDVVKGAEFSQLADRFGVSALSEADEAAYGIRAFTERFYTVVLVRYPDPAGFNGWVNFLTDGTYSGSDLARGFFLSPEYVNQNKSDSLFLDDCYQAYFDRAADPGGKQGWLDLMAQGMSREEVLNGFSGSQEFIKLAESYGIRPFAGYDVGDDDPVVSEPIPTFPVGLLILLAGLLSLFGFRKLRAV